MLNVTRKTKRLFVPVAMLTLACGLSACGTTRIVVNRPASACSALIPASWRKPVDPAPLPAADTLPEWKVFGVRQTTALGTQFERTASSIEIVEKCEARDAETVKALTPRPWWKLF